MMQHERYILGRKVLLTLGIATIVIFASMESKVIGRTWGSLGRLSISKEIPFYKFQLDPSDEYFVSIGDADGEEEFEHIVVTSVSIRAPPLEERRPIETSDMRLWDAETSVASKYPDALEWYRFSQVSASSGSKQEMVSSKKILIAQYSNRMELADVFALTKPMNRRYAEQWGHDIVFLNGQQIPREEANLASLLKLAWDERKNYEYVFLMDADGMIATLRYDMARLLPTNHMVGAKRPSGVDDWQVYDTISVWNLSHLLFPRVAKTWGDRFKTRDPLVGLAHQLKPYESEMYRLSEQIGATRRSHVRTMDSTWSSHAEQEVDAKALLKFWGDEAKHSCHAFKLDCAHPDEELARLKQLLKDTDRQSRR